MYIPAAHILTTYVYAQEDYKRYFSTSAEETYHIVLHEKLYIQSSFFRESSINHFGSIILSKMRTELMKERKNNHLFVWYIFIGFLVCL